MWFMFFSTDTAVWLTSLYASRQTSLPLAWLRVTTPALKGLSPVGTTIFLVYIHHSRHTHHLGYIGRSRVNMKISVFKKLGVGWKGTAPNVRRLQAESRCKAVFQKESASF
ncbi:hypothetical protein [Algoriphagus yeomjeoni]|uniref:Uncharacterized protein n=1 Tax=Algoriphagus yeomjeoni TaxID=291403 RepID=A0A327PTQ0_9BACT|nr:hypothetical protein [Algoriphagus yeomjeoni]RAI94784.1 hypothetical protein LV83_00030 [Algoriphagus yeomjeoni]